MTDSFVQEIAKWAKRKDERYIIGISGHGAAGKTTFAHQLLNLLQDEANYLNTDPYIINSQVRNNTMIDYTYENEKHCYKMTACHPAAHYVSSLERDIHMIRKGLDIYTIDTHYSTSSFIHSSKKKNNDCGRNGSSILQSTIMGYFHLFLYRWTYRTFSKN